MKSIQVNTRFYVLSKGEIALQYKFVLGIGSFKIIDHTINL